MIDLKEIVKNPSQRRFEVMLRRSGYEELRAIRWQGEWFVWDSSLCTHCTAAEALGIPSWGEIPTADWDNHTRLDCYFDLRSSDGVEEVVCLGLSGEEHPKWAVLRQRVKSEEKETVGS